MIELYFRGALQNLPKQKTKSVMATRAVSHRKIVAMQRSKLAMELLGACVRACVLRACAYIHKSTKYLRVAVGR